MGKPQRMPASQRFLEFFSRRGALAVAAVFVFVFACLIGIFAFTQFSGLSGAADFIYNQF